MAHNLAIGWIGPVGRPPAKSRSLPGCAHGPFIALASAGTAAWLITAASQLLGQALLDFPAVLPPQPLQVQYARPGLPLIPGRMEPPAVARRLLQPELQQAQQAQFDFCPLGRVKQREQG